MSKKAAEVLTAKNNLSDTNVVEIAMAGVPAVPGATFAVMKSMDIPEGHVPIVKTLIFKTDELKKQVFGYVLVPDDCDRQGDVMTAEEVEKACHSLLKNAFAGDSKGGGTSVNHVTFEGMGHPIESVIDKDGSIGKSHGVEGVPGGWWLGAQLTDEQWEPVAKGELTGFSIGGTGVRTPIDADAEPDVAKSVLAKAVEYVRERLTKAGEEPTDKALSFDEQEMMNKLWDELWGKVLLLNDVIISIALDPDIVDKRAAITAAIDEFKASLLGSIAIQKAGAEISAANMSTLEEVREASTKLVAMLDRIKDKGNDTETGAEIGKGEMDMDSKELTTALEKIGKRLDGLESARNIEPDDEVKKADEAKKAEEAEKAAELKKAEDAKKAEADAEVTKTLEEINKRLDKIEKTPATPNGSEGDESDDTTRRPAVNKGEPEKIDKAAVGGRLLFGTPPAKPEE